MTYIYIDRYSNRKNSSFCGHLHTIFDAQMDDGMMAIQGDHHTNCKFPVAEPSQFDVISSIPSDGNASKLYVAPKNGNYCS